MMLQTLNILRRIRDDKKLQDAGLSICPIVQRIMEKEGGMAPSTFGSVQKMLKEIFREWDCYSGDELYPVPNPRNPSDPESAYPFYKRAYVSGNMWRGSYGELRRNLLNFAIAYLEKRLDSYLPLEEINKVLHKIQPGLVASTHGFEYSITGAKTEGILPVQWRTGAKTEGILPVQWRTGSRMYGYKNTPTPTGWFYVSGIELETFVKGYE